MATYVILSRLSHDAVKAPGDLGKLAKTVSQKIKSECPQVRWRASYGLLGRYDVVDIVESESAAEVEKAAMIIRSSGHATTETMHATPWKEFVASL